MIKNLLAILAGALPMLLAADVVTSLRRFIFKHAAPSFLTFSA